MASDFFPLVSMTTDRWWTLGGLGACDPSIRYQTMMKFGLCPLVLSLLSHITSAITEIISKEHKTLGATIPKNELSCYSCDTAQDGPSCHNLSLHNNPNSFIKKCHDDKRLCVVKKFSYQVSTENATNKPKLWSLQRNCTAKCEPGCITIGERTKLLACTFCCNSNACNSMMGKSPSSRSVPIITFFISIIIPINFLISL